MARKSLNKSAGRMTLVELLATVAVLTALAAAAIAGLGDLASRTRQTSTSTAGYGVRSCVVGQSGMYSAFLSDLGRLPVVQSTDSGKGLGELFDTANVPADLKYNPSLSFDNSSWDGVVEGAYPVLTAAVVLPCGWRGPYLVQPGGKLYDGWGNDWQVYLSDSNGGVLPDPADVAWKTSTSATAGTVFSAIRSLGRDNTVDSGTVSWEDEDKTYLFEDNLAQADLTVELYAMSGGVYIAVNAGLLSNLQAAVYAPYATDTKVQVMRVLASNQAAISVKPDVAPADVGKFDHNETATWSSYNTILFRGLRPGIRKILAFGYNAGPANGVTSGVQVIELKPGGNIIKLYLSQAL